MFTLRKHVEAFGEDGKIVSRVAYLNHNGAPDPRGVIELIPLETQGVMVFDILTLNQPILEMVQMEVDQLPLVAISSKVSGTKEGGTNTARGCDWDDRGQIPRVLRGLISATESLLSQAIPSDLLDGLLKFNDFSLRKYSVTEAKYALSPHRDYSRYINLIAIWLLKGKGGLFICDDKEGTNAKEVEAEAGQLILLRGDGYAGLKDRPYHFVGSVKEDRITFTLRQNKERR